MHKRHTALNPDEIIGTQSSESSRSIAATDLISIIAPNVFGIVENTYPEYSGSP